MAASKRDYEVVAAALHHLKPKVGATADWFTEASWVADHFASTNKNFDKERFLKACWGDYIMPIVVAP